MSELGGLAGILKEYGGWGLSSVEFGAIVFLFKKLMECVDSKLALAERLFPLVEELRELGRARGRMRG